MQRVADLHRNQFGCVRVRTQYGSEQKKPTMLEELRVQNFAIIEEVVLEFAQGFNVITGETGAGKSILIDAVEMLLGSKADAAYVRAGADRAVVEGTFALDDETQALVTPVLLRENLIQDESEASFVTLSREIRSSGRSSARINGITCSADILREVGEVIVDIHGQSAHLSLFKPGEHVNLLDRYADLLEVREALTQVVESLNGIRREIKRLEDDKAELQRRAERLRYEVDEIDAAELDPDEEADLMTERNRLANSERLAELLAESVTLLSGSDDDGEGSAIDALMEVSTRLSKLAQIDPQMEEDYKLAEEISTNAQELSINLSGYLDEVEYDPARLDELEERLELIKRLKRRYNAETIAEILAYADKTREELGHIEHSEERLEELRAQEDKTLRHIGDLCERIGKVRDVAGRALSKKVMRELRDLRMENTRFEVILERSEDPNGAYARDGKRYKFDTTGMERVEFMMSANPGQPLRPLTKVASGGEAARIMLALKRVLTQADETPTLIFDEIDQGIGGRIGSVVGEKLWTLTKSHQVLCVTHLPQLASFGDQHFHVRKQVIDERTVTAVSVLGDEQVRVEELAAMLGNIAESGQQSARDILVSSQQRKLTLRAESEKDGQKRLI